MLQLIVLLQLICHVFGHSAHEAFCCYHHCHHDPVQLPVQLFLASRASHGLHVDCFQLHAWQASRLLDLTSLQR